MIELDNNATTRPDPEVVEAMIECLTTLWHNPSSIHRAGQAVRRKVELARQSVAALLGVKPGEIIFTSGATESINIAVRGLLAAAPPHRRTIITTPIEHEAVRDLCTGLESTFGVTVRKLPITHEGIVDTAPLEDPSFFDDSVALVTLQWANNETGAIHPVERIGAICRERSIPLHVDAAQWVGRMPANLAALPIDLLSLSAHKFHGPKGAGALFVRQGVRMFPLLAGSQERGRRGGTENTQGIIGLGVAAQRAMNWLADPAERNRIAALRDRFENALLAAVPGAAVNGPLHPDLRLWNTSNIGFPKLEADALLLLLSERGVNASAGAACGSGSLEASPVLVAMGVPESRAHGSVRFSLSRDSTDNDIDRALQIIPACVAKLQGSSAAALV